MYGQDSYYNIVTSWYDIKIFLHFIMVYLYFIQFIVFQFAIMIKLIASYF